MNIDEETDRPVLDPSGIGEFVKNGRCPMYAKLRYEGDEIEDARNWKEAFQPLSPLLSGEGNRFEQEIYDELEPAAGEVVDSWKDYDSQPENNQQIIDKLTEAAEKPAGSDPIFLEQAHFANDIEAFYVAGDSDLIIIWPQKGDSVKVRIFDIKASWDEKPYHQIQTATYSILLRQLVDEFGVDATVEIETGVITRESEISEATPDALPEFDTETRESDVKTLLDTGGIFDRVLGTPVEDIPFQFDEHSHNCPYNEACLTMAIEQKDISLLGLSRGEQEALQKHGFETLDDIAEVIDKPDNPRPYEYEYPDILPEYKDKVQSLSVEHSVGERLPILAQEAQALLGKLNEDHPKAHDKPWAQWIVGSGQGSLPDDDPHPSIDPCTDERGSLIRVYLNVQKDYIRDRVAVLSGRVDSQNYSGTPLTFSESIEEIPDSEEGHAQQEEQLLDDFIEQLFDSVQVMSRMTNQSGSAPIHLYFYGSQERDTLMEAVKRHPHSEHCEAVRDLLGLRGGIDQSMVSVVQDEVENRLALNTVSTGLLPTLEQTFPDDKHRLEFSDWKYQREDGTEVQLRDAFHHRLFDYSVPYKKKPESIELLLDGSYGDDFYVSRARFDAQIPLEYIWAAEGIDEFDKSWTDSPQYKGIIEMFQWVDSNSKDHRITREDLMALSEKFCEGLEHIERSLRYKNPDVEKENIDINEISSFSLGESTLASAIQDYLDLEYATTKQETIEHYQNPIKQRIMTGQSIPVEVESATIKDGLLTAKANLIYDEFEFESPQQVANSCRQKGSSGSTSGSRLVATPMEKQGDSFKADVSHPESIMHSTPVSIESMDTDSMTIKLKGFPNGGKKADKYRAWHKHYTIDPEDDDTLFVEGERFILDPSSDDLTSQRSDIALEAAESNTIYNTLVEMNNGEDTSRVERFDAKQIDEFVDWLVENYDPSPNERQQKFIRETGGEVSLLQGPPGTGKTSGAIALSVLARLYASESPVRSLVTGASNKAVDEMMEDVADALSEYQNTGDDSLDEVRLIRLTGEKPENPIKGVEYVNYHTDTEAVETIETRLKQSHGNRQSSLSEHENDSVPHIVVFATPSRTFGLAKQIARNMDFRVDQAYDWGLNLFDLYAADEASMLPLPQLLLGGAFLDEENGWQALIAGDQRQMPPVQTHDWMKEDRRTIEEVAPFLSTLDYFRFLRGEPVESLEDFDELNSPNVDIPITRLQETYRCHSAVADFLRRWVYSKDDIEYSSSLTHTISDVDSGSDSIDAVLNPEQPITLVLHDDERSQQSNLVEATLARDIVNETPNDASVGIVTPHNSQKGLLESVCDKGQVDTVERFQGGERDVMILSATVSDPDYLSAESDFILDPNRLNVALSRMRKKLVVLAPRSIFRMIPDDIEGYENATIWKGLYSEVEPNNTSEWEGDLDDFTTNMVLGDAETSVEVYSTEESHHEEEDRGGNESE